MRLRAIALGFIALLTVQGHAPAAETAGQPASRQLVLANAAFSGDFDKMLERRLIRVAAPYSRSLFYNDHGQERGLSAELARDFERFLNSKYKKQLGKRPLTIAIIAVTRDQLLPKVAAGQADLALGNLTVTPERLKLVDMVTPEREPTVREILVTGPQSPAIASLDDLSGKTVHVRRSSSYYESLVSLNTRLRSSGKPAINIVLVPDALEDEDMMEMLGAGLLQAILVDDWKAKMWAPVWPKLLVHADVVLREDGQLGWGVRKNSPLLKAELLGFYNSWVKKQGIVPYRLGRDMKRVKQLRNPTAAAELKRFQNTVALFEKYGGEYRFDPLMLAAQGYQESRLNQNVRSRVGAIGVMQIMPATGAQMKVGDIKLIEPNIHAGAKYMDHLVAAYLSDGQFNETDRTLFAFAAYNCGPGNLAKARKEAARRGLDPNLWFDNVEVTVSEQIGAETTTYVRNIFKYYVAYKLIEAAQARLEDARDSIATKKN